MKVELMLLEWEERFVQFIKDETCILLKGKSEVRSGESVRAETEKTMEDITVNEEGRIMTLHKRDNISGTKGLQASFYKSEVVSLLSIKVY